MCQDAGKQLRHKTHAKQFLYGTLHGLCCHQDEPVKFADESRPTSKQCSNVKFQQDPDDCDPHRKYQSGRLRRFQKDPAQQIRQHEESQHCRDQVALDTRRRNQHRSNLDPLPDRRPVLANRESSTVCKTGCKPCNKFHRLLPPDLVLLRTPIQS